MTRCLSTIFTRSAVLAVLSLAMACCGSGCYWHGMYAPGGCGPCSTPMVSAGCDSCGGSCGGTCSAPCEQFPGSCGSCLPGGCGGFSGMMLPLLSSRLACGSGCGDLYWGDWISDAPGSCGPCDGNGGWVGSDYGGCGPCGYGPVCGGLLAGPVEVIRGTTLGVTNLIHGTFRTLHYGYRMGVCGYPAACGYPAPCGCDECSGSVSAPACESCGNSACSGDCARLDHVSPSVARHAPLGSGVQSAWAQGPARHTPKPPHRLVTNRMRR